MGDHYVPQRYLRNFEIPGAPGQIWMFDKKSGKTARVAIKQVAAERGFYEPEIERELGEKIEKPGHRVIAKLLAESQINADERLELSVYIATMLKRVPHRRKKAYRMFPETTEETKRHMAELFAELAANRGTGVVDPEETLAEADQYLEAARLNPPEAIVNLIRTPWPNNDEVEAIHRMTWRLLKPPRTEFFLTSDNPAVFHECYGLENSLAELVFPLSPRSALHGCLNPGLSDLGFIGVNSTIVREFNRRIAHGVTRFAFCHEEKDWIIRLIQKSSHNLKHIRFDHQSEHYCAARRSPREPFPKSRLIRMKDIYKEENG